ncbi:MAG TPA: hypothetical protein VFM94_02405 [Solirubrobacterales bacterium]|nr:hypothetical protein [Solirubrobacterales bacterium]
MEAAQPPAPAPAKRIAVGEVIGETFSIYGQNLAALLGSAIVVFVVVGLIAGILQSAGGVILIFLAGALRLAGQALYVGFVVKLVEDVRDGRRDLGVGDLFSAASPFILPLIGFGILFGIGVTIGFVLLVIPGLILITFWSVGAPAIVVEGIGPIDAFRRSWRLVRGDAWAVFGTLLVVLLIVIVIGVVLAAIANPIGNGEASTWIASIVSTTITAPIFAIAVTVLYHDLAGGTSSSASPAGAAAPPAP